ncbi:nardilysin-like [Primulina tabacum]|uniref:nardilysin-like n=1 Tax=Primulina tabacum TaxID=48773 RepID=UPI003F5A1064
MFILKLSMQSTCVSWEVMIFQMKMSYLSKHGGSSNAYTETEHTCYHFEVKKEFLKGALTRFAQFFISPLVKAEAMEREGIKRAWPMLWKRTNSTVKTFENYKNGLMGKLLEKDPSLLHETNRFWGQIVDKRYMFDLSKKEAEELNGIQKKDMMDWYRTYLRQPSPKCRRLVIRVWGCNADLSNAQVTSAQVIGDLAEFKKNSEFYPSFC